MDTFTCESCGQELSLEEQSFDFEGSCESCHLEASGEFSLDDSGATDDICQECDDD